MNSQDQGLLVYFKPGFVFYMPRTIGHLVLKWELNDMICAFWYGISLASVFVREKITPLVTVDVTTQ